MAIANLVVRIAADLADFERGIASAERSLARSGRSLENVGSRLTRGLTLPLVAGLGLAAKAAIDFESSFAGVRKTVDATEGDFKQLEGQFRQLARTMPLSVNEINRVAEAAGQLGVKKDRITDFTETMVKLGATTNLTADEAATGMARFANALGQPTINVDKLAAALVALGNDGASTERDILDLAKRMAGAGAQIGLSAGSIFGMANALSSVGIEAEKGGSAISRLFNDLNAAVSNGGGELKAFADVARLTSAEFATLFKADSASAISKFIEGLAQTKAEGGDLLKVLNALEITELRYRDTVLLAANSGAQFAASIRLGNQAFEEGKAANAEYQERLRTTASQLVILRNNITDAAITLGQAFLPIINSFVSASKPMVSALADMAQAFKDLPSGVQNVAFAFAAVLASLGPVVYAIGTVQTAMSGLFRVFRFFIPEVAATGTAAANAGRIFTGFAGTVGRFAGPIGLVMNGLFAVKEAFDAFSRSTTEGLRVVSSAIPGVGLLATAIEGLANVSPRLRAVFDDIATILRNTVIIAFDLFQRTLDITREAFVRFGSAILERVRPALEVLLGPLERIGQVIRTTVIPALIQATAAFLQMIPGVAGVIQLLSVLPGFEKIEKSLDGAAAATQRLVDRINGAQRSVNALGSTFSLNGDVWGDAIKKLGFGPVIPSLEAFGSGVQTNVVAPLKRAEGQASATKKRVEELLRSLQEIPLLARQAFDFSRYQQVGRDGGPQIPQVGRSVLQADLVAQLTRDMENLNRTTDFGALSTRQFIATWDRLPQVNATVKEVSKGIGELSAALANLAQVSGGTFGGMVSSLARVVASIDSAQKGMEAFSAGRKEGGFGGFLGMTTGILGIVTAALAAGQAIKGLFDSAFGSKGRDTVKDFAASFGGFDSLRQELIPLGAEGERLWIALTQGVGRNNPEQARAAIEAVTAALARQKLTQRETATEATATAKAIVDAQEASVKTLQTRIGDLTQEYDRLFASIRDEAPEEVMGVVEALTRARMDAIATERQGVQSELEQLQASLKANFEALGQAAKDAAQTIADAFNGIRVPPIRIPIEYIDPGLPGLTVPAMARGGIVTRPTLALIGERGPEAVVPLAQYQARATGGSGGVVNQSFSVTIQAMDGASVQRVVESPDFGSALRRAVTRNSNQLGSVIREAVG